MRTISILPAMVLLLACAGAPQPPSAPPATAAVDGGEARVLGPAINAPYTSPDLDVLAWDQRFSGESREVFVHRMDVVAAMGLKPGDRIADVGAGSGIYVKPFAQAVGAGGKVYAVDIAQPFLDYIKENAAKDGLTQVVTVLGEEKSTTLPAGSLDVVFHSDVYHHFEFPLTMNRHLAEALSPGGRMFVIDFERIEGVTNPQMLAHVRAGKETVIAEIESSGFDFVREIEIEGFKDNYFIEFVKE